MAIVELIKKPDDIYNEKINTRLVESYAVKKDLDLYYLIINMASGVVYVITNKDLKLVEELSGIFEKYMVKEEWEIFGLDLQGFDVKKQKH